MREEREEGRRERGREEEREGGVNREVDCSNAT